MNVQLIACAIGFLATSALRGEMLDSPLNMKVDAEGKADITGKDAKTQTRTLKIALSNTGKEVITGATIKWMVFGHNMKDHHLVQVKSGEIRKDLPAGITVEVSSERLKISGVREHSVRSRSGSGRRARTTFKKVPASGQEYYGYAVQVFDREKLLAETYSQPSFKKLINPKS